MIIFQLITRHTWIILQNRAQWKIASQQRFKPRFLPRYRVNTVTKYDRVRKAITTDPSIPESRSPNRKLAGIGRNKVENSDRCFPHLRSWWRRRRKRKTDFKGGDIRAFIRQNSSVANAHCTRGIHCLPRRDSGRLIITYTFSPYSSLPSSPFRSARVNCDYAGGIMIFMARRHWSLTRTKNMKMVLWRLRSPPMHILLKFRKKLPKFLLQKIFISH